MSNRISQELHSMLNAHLQASMKTQQQRRFLKTDSAQKRVLREVKKIKQTTPKEKLQRLFPKRNLLRHANSARLLRKCPICIKPSLSRLLKYVDKECNVTDTTKNLKFMGGRLSSNGSVTPFSLIEVMQPKSVSTADEEMEMIRSKADYESHVDPKTTASTMKQIDALRTRFRQHLEDRFGDSLVKAFRSIAMGANTINLDSFREGAQKLNVGFTLEDGLLLWKDLSKDRDPMNFSEFCNGFYPKNNELYHPACRRNTDPRRVVRRTYQEVKKKENHCETLQLDRIVPNLKTLLKQKVEEKKRSPAFLSRKFAYHKRGDDEGMGNKEFSRLLKSFGCFVNEDDTKALYKTFVNPKSNRINKDEFVNALKDI